MNRRRWTTTSTAFRIVERKVARSIHIYKPWSLARRFYNIMARRNTWQRVGEVYVACCIKSHNLQLSAMNHNRRRSPILRRNETKRKLLVEVKNNCRSMPPLMATHISQSTFRCCALLPHDGIYGRRGQFNPFPLPHLLDYVVCPKGIGWSTYLARMRWTPRRQGKRERV